MSVEKRRFSRVLFRVEAEMTVNDVVYRAEEVSNISVGGCLLPITADLEVGTECHVKISLTGTTEDLSVQVDGQVLRCAPGAVAIKFIRIDLDSFCHLQNIVRFNSLDPDRVAKEIPYYPGME